METSVECFHFASLALDSFHVDLELGRRFQVLAVDLFVSLDPLMPGIDLALEFAESPAEIVQLLALSLGIHGKPPFDLLPAQTQGVNVLQGPALLVPDEADFLLKMGNRRRLRIDLIDSSSE